jgi:hypothetical protein
LHAPHAPALQHCPAPQTPSTQSPFTHDCGTLLKPALHRIALAAHTAHAPAVQVPESAPTEHALPSAFAATPHAPAAQLGA